MRMKIKNRILASVLSFLIIIATAFSGVTTAKAAEGDTTGGLQVGHRYIIPLKGWQYSPDEGKNIEIKVNTISVLNRMAHEAIVEPEENGKYKLTIEVNNYDKVSAFQIFKQGTLPDETRTGGYKLATIGLDSYSSRDKIVKAGWMDEENDKKIYASDEITIDGTDYSANKFLTFEINNLDDFLYFNSVTDIGHSWGEYGSSRPYSADLVQGKLTLDTSSITAVPDKLDDYLQGNAVFDIVSHRKYDDYNFEEDGQKLNNYVQSIVTKQGDSLNLRLSTNSDKAIKEMYINSVSENVTRGSVDRYEGVSKWNQLDVVDGCVNITINNLNDAIFGREIHIVMNDDTEFYATLKLRKDSKSEVSIESNGVTLISDSYNINSDVKFSAVNETEGSDYETAMSTVGGISTLAKMYTMSLTKDSASYTPNNRVRLSFDIPEGWNAEKTQLYVFFADEKSSMNINSAYGTVELIDGKLCYDTTKVDGYKYILFQKSDVTDVTTLSDGVYSVGVNIWNYETPDSPSMANNAVKGGRGKLYIYNNGANKDLYFDMQGITIPLNGESFFGYMYRMFYYPQKDSSDGDKKEVNITKYMVDENNSADIDDYHLKYPESVAIPIPETFDFTKNKTTLKNVFKINVIVPIMDGLAGGEPGEGASARDALVQILDAEKIENESTHTLTASLKDVNKDTLKKYIDKADGYNSSDYDSTAFETFSKVLTESKNVYNNVNSDQTTVDNQTDALVSAVETLTGETIVEYEEGVYTADSRIVETDGTLGYHQGIAGDTRIVVAEDGTATVRMTVEKAKTVMDGQELASYNIDGFLYKSGTEFKSATVLDSIEVDGTKYPSLVSFPLDKVKKLTQVGFYSDGDTSWVNEVGLELTNIKKQNTDKTKLAALIDELEKLDNSTGIYTTSSFDSLTSALKTAKSIYDDEFAIKNEIDEQVSKLNEAKDGLKEVNASLNLKEGVYTVDSRIVETDGTLGYHQGIAGDTRIAVDADGNATVYMTIEKAKTVMDGQELASYNIDGFLYKDGSVFKEAVVLETTEIDGTKYPVKVSFPIGSAKKLTQVGFYSDGDTSWVNEIGLELTNAIKQKADKTELKALIEELEKIDNSAGKYTSDSYNAVIEALKSSKVVNDNPVAIQKEIDNQVNLLTTAKNGLKEENVSLGLEEGTYTVNSRIVETDGTLGYHQGIAGDTTLVVDADGNATVYMTIEKAKTVMDGQELASYNIDGFLYKDGTEFKEATVLETTEIDGTKYPTKVSFPVGVAKKLIQVGFYSDGDTSWINEVALELTDPKKQETTIASGTYSIDGILRMATSDRNSMGNPAIVKPMTLVVDGDSAALKIEFVPLTTKLGSKDFTGYLAKLNYFTGWTGGDTGVEPPDNIEAKTATVDSYYDGVYDSYNDPSTGTDENVKGKLYPHYVSMPVTLNAETTWVQVYVPVMEAIQTGGGLQYARLMLDWSSLKPVSENTLNDGDYTLNGDMVKIDKKTASMSDEAINHKVKLSVKNGKYYVTLSFKGLTISGQKGYLSTLKYFQTGYTLDNFGNPQGTLQDVAVDSYQKNSDGSLVSDSFGTNYPDEVTFELIPEAIKDGFAPLQVFVPIMESLSEGTGTQPVFLKLDWTSLKSADDNTQEIVNLDDGLYTVSGEIREADSDAVSTWNNYLDKVRLIAEDGKITAYIDFKSVSGKTVAGISTGEAQGVAVKNSRAVVVLPENVELTDVQLTDNKGETVNARLYLALRSASVQKVDKTSLKKFIDSANAIKKDGKTYTDATVKALDEALANADKVYADEVAITSEVSAAGLALKNAINGMTEVVKTDISKAKVSGVTNKYYTGKAITQDKNIKVTLGKKTLVQNTDYKVSYKNNKNRGKAIVTITGIGSYNGSCNVTFDIVQKVTPEVTLSAKTFAYTGKAVTPKVVVKISGKTVSSTGYTVKMSTGRKALGTYKVAVTLKGYYRGTKTVAFKIVPKGTNVTKFVAGKKAFAVRWTAQKTQTTGYQIQYSTSDKFKSAKTVTVKGNGNVTKKVTNLAAKKKYYVRVRTYKSVGKTIYYSTWSKAKTVTTK